MKKLIFGLLATGFFTFSSFATINSAKCFARQCTYNMYNAAGNWIGQQTIIIPDSMSCGSSAAKAIAIDAYNS
jgi:hypothetical protein